MALLPSLQTRHFLGGETDPLQHRPDCVSAGKLPLHLQVTARLLWHHWRVAVLEAQNLPRRGTEHIPVQSQCAQCWPGLSLQVLNPNSINIISIQVQSVQIEPLSVSQTCHRYIVQVVL